MPIQVGPTSQPFFGSHQGGVITPAQSHLRFVAFDMVDGTDRRDLGTVLRCWSVAAARMTAGLAIGASDGEMADPELPPDDTGETMGLTPAGLTITVGFGPSLFERDGVDRFGIASARPPELEPLPPFPGDTLDPARSDGDLCVQVCADDPTVAVHAVRNLARMAARHATIRWSQTGFVRDARSALGTSTPRNLMGFKDGTNNIAPDDRAAHDEHVWIPADATPAWLGGGTYLVVRKFAILLDGWDREPVSVQEATFGRAKHSGAPLSGGDEASAPDFEARSSGRLTIDPASHMRLAHPSANGGIRLLRRGYDYFDGTAPDGRFDGGLLFISFQRSPARFISVQRSLAKDRLNEYIRPVGSALFAVPPGVSIGGFVGETLID
jgi:deferrochelatase/peroxidase EfeB